MPKKLSVAILLLAVSALLSLLTQDWLSALLSGTLIAGALKGHEGARTMLRFFAAAGAANAAFSLVFGPAAAADFVGGGALSAALIVGAAAYGLLQHGYVFWALGQQDVQQWMFDKSTGGLDAPDPF
ncbi:MAG: hypothetical protein AAF411_12050 [Myxococcota bacterium]